MFFAWLAKCAPFFSTNGKSNQTNKKQYLVRTRFPALNTGYMYSNSDWLITLFTSVVIGQNNLALASQHSIENCSILDMNASQVSMVIRAN